MKKILEFFGSNVIGDIGKVIDNLFTSEEERINAKNKIMQVLKEKELELNLANTKGGRMWSRFPTWYAVKP